MSSIAYGKQTKRQQYGTAREHSEGSIIQRQTDVLLFGFDYDILLHGVRLMPKPENTTPKTERILTIFHMFRFFEEVSMQEMRNAFEDLSDKTFSRDIALLKRAGLPIQFSVKRNAYVLKDEAGNESRKAPRRKPDYPEGKKERQYLEKIVRLTTMMD